MGKRCEQTFHRRLKRRPLKQRHNNLHLLKWKILENYIIPVLWGSGHMKNLMNCLWEFKLV